MCNTATAGISAEDTNPNWMFTLLAIVALVTVRRDHNSNMFNALVCEFIKGNCYDRIQFNYWIHNDHCPSEDCNVHTKRVIALSTTTLNTDRNYSIVLIVWRECIVGQLSNENADTKHRASDRGDLKANVTHGVEVGGFE